MHHASPGVVTMSSRAPCRRAAARHRVEAEAKRLRLDVRQRAQLEADGRDTRRTVRPRGILDDLEHAFGERHLMHARPRRKGDAGIERLHGEPRVLA